jgi:hypothetical protein
MSSLVHLALVREVRDKDICTRDVGKYISFFHVIRWGRISVNSNNQRWDSTFVEKVKLDKSFVDLLLRLIVL